jgi:hypothetical protein
LILLCFLELKQFRWRRAPSLRVEVIPINMRDVGEIEQHVETFARASPSGGLIPMASASAVRHRDLIVTLVTRHNLPSAYWERFFVAAGGLILTSSGKRPATSTVFSKGEKLADLPVQAPTRYELLINLKTAKAIGLEVPPTLLARADESNEEARVHHAARRRGGMAGRGARAASACGASARSPATDTPLIAVIRQGLNETGFVGPRRIGAI